MENDRTLVPLRAVFEAMGAEVLWDEATQTITAVRGNTGASAQAGTLSENDTVSVLREMEGKMQSAK